MARGYGAQRKEKGAGGAADALQGFRQARRGIRLPGKNDGASGVEAAADEQESGVIKQGDRVYWVDAGFCGIEIPIFFDVYSIVNRYGNALDDEDFNKITGKALFMERGSSVEFPIYLAHTGASTILHEVVHAVSYLMEHLGIEDDEFRAYITVYLFHGIKKIAKKRSGKVDA